MKTFLTLATILVASTVHSAPPKPKNPNSELIKEFRGKYGAQFQEIWVTVDNTMQNLKDVLTPVNPKVGNILKQKKEEVAINLEAKGEEADNGGVSPKEFNKEILERFKQLMVDSLESVKSDLDQLPRETRDKVIKDFDTGYDKVKEIAKAIVDDMDKNY